MTTKELELDTTKMAREFIEQMRLAGSPDEDTLAAIEKKIAGIEESRTLSQGTGPAAAAAMHKVNAAYHDAAGNTAWLKEARDMLAPTAIGMSIMVSNVSVVGGPPADVINVHLVGTPPDIAKLRTLVAENYTEERYVPVFHETEAGHITNVAEMLLNSDPACKTVCIAPNPRFVRDFETYLGAHVRATGYKVKQVGGFTTDSVLTDWPSIAANELITALKAALEERCDDTSPLNGMLPQIQHLEMEIRGHGVALFVIKTPEGKEEPYELKLELRKLNE